MMANPTPSSNMRTAGPDAMKYPHAVNCYAPSYPTCCCGVSLVTLAVASMCVSRPVVTMCELPLLLLPLRVTTTGVVTARHYHCRRPPQTGLLARTSGLSGTGRTIRGPAPCPSSRARGRC